MTLTIPVLSPILLLMIPQTIILSLSCPSLHFQRVSCKINRNRKRKLVTFSVYALNIAPYTIVEDEEPFEYLLDNKELHNFALQIANGMRFLEEQEITHR